MISYFSDEKVIQFLKELRCMFQYDSMYYYALTEAIAAMRMKIANEVSDGNHN